MCTYVSVCGCFAEECPCTAEELSRVSYGLIISGRSPIQSSLAVHGLSGRRLRDISEDLLCVDSAALIITAEKEEVPEPAVSQKANPPPTFLKS